MTPTDWIYAAGITATFLLGLFNFFGGHTRNKSIGMLERGQYLESVNKSVQLANDRALAAEKRTIDAENRANSFEDRMAALESTLAYRLTFDVLLGSNPSVEHVKIEHYPERRTNIVNVEKDRRKNN